MDKNQQLEELIIAEAKAARLFLEIETREIIKANVSEKDVNTAVYDLAFELFGIKKYWHKRIVRAGKNTLLPYKHNPDNLIIQEDDIMFLDFGPVFEAWEADFGRTYVIGSNEKKLKLKADVERAWHEGKAFYQARKETITASELFHFTKTMAQQYGWTFGNHHCGHLIGNFPHEIIQGEELANYIHADNTLKMSDNDRNSNPRFWIYEIHFIDEALQIGGFFEQLVD